MEQSKTPKKRGGARPGAGRKKKTSHIYTVYATEEVEAYLNSVEGSISDFICNCILEEKRRAERKKKASVADRKEAPATSEAADKEPTQEPRQYRVAIVGSRGIDSVDIGKCMESLPCKPTVIVSGGAKGVDRLAEIYAEANGIPVDIHKPDYKKHLQGAPIRRNEDIVNASDAVVAIWDGKSRGTSYTVRYAEKQGKPVFVFAP